jgi:phosphatidylglycerophosphate synthase
MRGLAVVLATRPEAALHRVAGMSLLERVVRTAGATNREVIVTGEDPSVLSALGGAVDARFEPPAGLSAVLAAGDGAATLWLAHHVYDRGAAATLEEHAAQYETASVGPALLLAHTTIAGSVITAADPEAALRSAAAAAPQLPHRGMSSVDAGDDAGASAAAEALWQSCRKPVDGYVSRHLNRHISLAISRRIVDTSITPNQVSALCIALGILSGVFAAHGGYGYLLAGATLFQLNSILDGVDGELARVRWAHSKIGELLDSAGDNLANFSFFGGVAVAALRAGEHDLATAGLLGLSLWALYLVFLYSRLSGSGRGDVMQVRTSLDGMRSPLVHALLALGRKVLRRDSFVMVSFVAAVLGYAPQLLVMILAGGGTVFTYAMLHFAARWLRPAQELEVDSR